MAEPKEPVLLPLYSQLAQVVLGLVAFFYVLFIGKEIILPLVFASLIAILLNPFVNFLTNKKLNRIIAIAIALLLAILFIVIVSYFIGSQFGMFIDSMPQFKEKFTALFHDIINWISRTFNVSKARIDVWIEQNKGEGLNKSTALVGQTLGTISGLFVYLVLVPVYVFLILFYKPLLLTFISKLFKHDQNVVEDVLEQTKSLIQNYLVGLLVEAFIIAVLNSAGLLIIGIQYAILLGIIGAMLNVIPYIGGIVAVALPMLVAFVTKSPTAALWVLLAYSIVQFIDNHFIVPKIVASKVKINALVSIVVVLLGDALWGVPGMFLSIPLTAIIKVIFDRVDSLKHFGFLLGNDQPEMGNIVLASKKSTENPQ